MMFSETFLSDPDEDEKDMGYTPWYAREGEPPEGFIPESWRGMYEDDD